MKEYGKRYWLFPGGKQEPGESIEAALIREAKEELSVGVNHVTNLGMVEGHTPDGVPLTIHLFGGAVDGRLERNNEIEQLRWVRRAEVPEVIADLTPISIEKVFPYLDQQEIW